MNLAQKHITDSLVINFEQIGLKGNFEER